MKKDLTKSNKGKPVVRVPIGEGKRPGEEIGLPENLRVMHAEEHNPHDG